MPFKIKNELSNTMLSFRAHDGSRVVIEPGEYAIVSQITPGIEALRIKGRLSYVETDDHCVDDDDPHTPGHYHPMPEPRPDASSLLGIYKHEKIIITNQHILDKKFSLSTTVTSNDTVIFLPEGGIPQFPLVDFTATGNKILWGGLGLDGFIEADDIVHIYYR
jgi:hypothetical protein